MSVRLLFFLTFAFVGITKCFGSTQDLVVSHFTGPEGGIGTRDARGTAARFNSPSGIWAAAGYLYVADSANGTIRRISIATADVTTLAGSPQKFGTADGVGANAQFLASGSIWSDGSNVYVQNGCAVRKISIPTATVSTFAGIVNCGTGSASALPESHLMTGDGTNLYWIVPGFFAIRGSSSAPASLRVISLADGSVRSAPLPQIPNTSIVGPSAIWVGGGYLYMLFATNTNAITLARLNVDTQQAESLVTVPTACNCSSLSGLWSDGRDAFYFVEKNTLRRIVLSPRSVESIAALPAATVNGPASVVGVGDDVFVADTGASIVSRVRIPAHEAIVFAGLQFNAPPGNSGVGSAAAGWSDGRYLYTASGNEVRRVDLATKASVVIASGFNSPAAIWGDSTSLYVGDYGYGVVYRVMVADGIPRPLVTGLHLMGIWGDSTYLYVTADNTVQRIDKATGEVTTLAGSFRQFGATDGTGSAARFNEPEGIWGDSTFLYVADWGSGIRRIRISTGEVTTLTTQTHYPSGIVGDGTDLYVGDTFQAIKKITVTTDEVTSVLAASGARVLWADQQSVYFSVWASSGAIDRLSLATGDVSRITPPAEFSESSVPSDRIPVKASWSDGTFLYGFSGGALYKVRLTNGEIIHIAGVYDEFGLADGVGNHARFLGPMAVWGNGADLYVVDQDRIRHINLTTQQVDSFAGFQPSSQVVGHTPRRIWGDAQYLYVPDNNYKLIYRVSIATHESVGVVGDTNKFNPDFVDGVGTAARLFSVGPIWGDGTNLYISDACTIRKIALSNFTVTTFVGAPNNCAQVDGSKDVARFLNINDIWGNGRLLYVTGNHTVRTVDLLTGETRTIAGSTAFYGTENGSALDARFLGPDRLVGTGADLYVSDNGIRKISTLTSTQSFSISTNSAVYRATPPTDASLTRGYARVQAAIGSSNAAGIAIFSYRANGVTVSETSVQASPLVQSGRIYAEIGDVVKTGIAIVNPNDAAAALSFYFTDHNGINFGPGSTMIPPRQQIAAFLDEAPFNGYFSAQTFTFSSPVPVGAVALRGFINERSEFLMTTLPVAATASTSSSTVVLPHFASGGGWRTQVLLVNPTDDFISGSVVTGGTSTLYAIPPRSGTKVVLADTGTQTQTGSVSIVSALGTPAPVVSSLFTFVSNGVTVTESGVASTGTAQTFRVLAEVDSARAMQTGIAIANTAASPADIQLDLFDRSGQPSGFTGALNVPANGHASLFLNQISGFANLPSFFRGVLRITSSTQISVAGLRGLYNERGDFLISTTPALPDAPSSTADVIFPHFVTGNGYTTEFILMNSGPTSAGTLSLYSQSGSDLPLLPPQ